MEQGNNLRPSTRTYDPTDPDNLKRDLVDPFFYSKMYITMPRTCRDVVDDPNNPQRIGYNELYGWYILDVTIVDEQITDFSVYWSQRDDE